MSDTAPAWQGYGNCVGVDPDLFFPDEHDEVAVARAVDLCLTCPVRPQCHEYAVTHRLDFGVFGATTGAQRRYARTRARRAARKARR